MKATAVAPSNIAFIKYWGVKNAALRIPTNGSISMNLSNLITKTTVEFDSTLEKDEVICSNSNEQKVQERILEHIKRIRDIAKRRDRVKVATENNFPMSTGLSSSASGFAALTLAACAALDLHLSQKELSILARLGSGSACRSIPGGFVEWLPGQTSETSYAVSLYPPEYWDIVDVVACVSSKKKETSSTAGHLLATSSPFFEKRLETNIQKIRDLKHFLKHKDFTAFGELIEAEALELHAIYLTSHPSLIYLLPESLRLLHAVKQWRKEGLETYFTLNTGQDVHIICQKKNVKKTKEKLSELYEVKQVIVNHPSEGTRLTNDHLF